SSIKPTSDKLNSKQEYIKETSNRFIEDNYNIYKITLESLLG
ncbi:26556_t:CDS:2, partial [Racocetra persica]